MYSRLILIALFSVIIHSVSAQRNQKGAIDISTIGTDELYDLTLEQLLNMEVSVASKSSQKVSDAPGAISVVTKDEIARFGGTTLKDILMRVPSLNFSTVYMTDRSIISSRGDQLPNNSNHVLLLINGRPVREALEGGIKSEIYESFPVNIIERIEVIRGPGSVLYGSNAISGVINIITESADQNNVDVSAIIGNGGAKGALAEAKLKAGKFNAVAAGRYFQKAEWETDFSYPNAPFASGHSTTRFTIPNESTGLFLDMNYGNLRVMSSYTEWTNNYTVSDYIPIAAAFFDGAKAYGNNNFKKYFADAGYRLNATDNWDMDFNLTYTRSLFETAGWPFDNRDSYEMVGEWTNSYTPVENLDIVFGGLFNYFDGQEWGPGPEGRDTLYTDASRNSLGAYAQANYKILSNLNLIGGLQANKVKDLDLNIVPRIGMIWYPVSKLNVKAFYGEAYRAPSINEFSIKHTDMLGNPNLLPETVSTFDFGVGYQGEKINASINFFHSEMDHVVFQNRDSTVGPLAMYMNGQDVKFTGIEYESKWYVSREFLFTSSLLYQTNKNESGVKNVSPMANFGAKIGLSYMKDGLTLSLFDVYQGKLDENYDTNFNPSPGAYNILNFHGKYNFNRIFNTRVKTMALFMQVDNLLNEEIWLPDWGLSPGKSIPYIQGRAIYVGMNLSLN